MLDNLKSGRRYSRLIDTDYYSARGIQTVAWEIWRTKRSREVYCHGST